MRKYLFLIFCLVIWQGKVAAQSVGPDPSGLISDETRQSMIKSGTANASGLYNVDLYSGTANVSIPIHDYNVGGLNLGISLGYATSGIRVDDRAGSCGLGFELNAGGSITREVRGVEDDVTIKSKRSTAGTDYSAYNGTWIPVRPGGSAFDATERAPDLFTASFGGRTLKFQINRPQVNVWEVKTFPRSKVKIELTIEQPRVASNVFSNDEPDSNLWSFRITDENKNVFTFKRGEYHEQVVPYSYYDNGLQTRTFTYYPTTRWNLVSIRTNSGQTITYNYSFRQANYIAYKTERVREIYDGTMAGISVLENKEELWSGTTSSLDQIIYPNGIKVDFTYDEGYYTYSRAYPRPLTWIKISQGYDNNLKRLYGYYLQYSFFHSPIPADTVTTLNLTYTAALNRFQAIMSQYDATSHMQKGLRLKLDRIYRSGEGLTEKAYEFSYEAQPLPERLNPGRDYYGYANGQVATTNNSDPALRNLSVNKHSFLGLTTYGVDKTPNLAYAKGCLLNGIKTGNGGEVTFRYKDHNLYNPAAAYNGSSSSNKIYPAYEGANANDGICIDIITVKDGYREDNTTSTKYEFSGGQRFMRGGFSWYYNLDNNIWGTSHIYTNNFVAPPALFNGHNHGYTYAEEKKYSSGGQLLGSSRYHYTNLIIETDSTRSALHASVDSGENTCPVKIFYQGRLGHPLDVKSYDRLGNLMTDVTYTYEDSITKGSFDRYNSFAIPSPFYNPTYPLYYLFNNAPFRMHSKKETSYTNNGSFVKELTYTYDTTDNVQTIAWTDDFGVPTLKRFQYGYRQYESGPAKGTYLPLRTDVIKQINGVDKLVDATTTDYGAPTVNGTTALLYQQSSRQLNENLDNSGILKQTEYVSAYDPQGNTSETRLDSQEVYTASIWDTRIGKKVAAVSNARFADVAYTSFEGPTKALGTADENKGNWELDPGQITYVTPGLTGQPMTGHYYYRLNSTGVVSQNALTTGKKYLVTFWASNSPSVTVSGAAKTPTQHFQVGSWKFYSVQITGSNAPVKVSDAGGTILLDELRLYPADATMVSTAYEPLFGPNSQCDGSGNIVYYEYDGFGRPTVTRDINRNVLSATQYVTQGADTNN